MNSPPDVTADAPFGRNDEAAFDRLEDALELGEDHHLPDERGARRIDNPNGVRIEPREDLQGLVCRLSETLEEQLRARLVHEGTVLERQTIGTLAAGDAFAFRTPLSAGQQYDVLIDAGADREYTRGRAEVEYPVEGERLAAVAGVYSRDGATSDAYRYNVAAIAPLETPYDPVADADFDRPAATETVDVVESDAIDHDGDLAAEIRAYVGTGTEPVEFVLPAGSYDWSSGLALSQPIEYVEIRGDPRASLEVRSHEPDAAFEFGEWDASAPPQKVVVRNVDVDIADAESRDCGLILANVGRAVIDNVELVGTRWRHGPDGGDRYTLLVNTWDADAESLVRNVSLPDGAVADTEEGAVGHEIGFSADPPHEGRNVWQRCFVAGYVDNGFYTANSPGENVLEECVAANCGNGNVRPGINDAVRDCRIVLDRGSDQRYPGAGLWLNGGRPVAERITIAAPDAGNDVVRVNSGADGGVITDLDVTTGADAPSPTLRCTATSETDPVGVRIENFVLKDASSVTTTDDGDPVPSVRIARPDVELADGVIEATHRDPIGGDRDPDLENVDVREGQ
ncbi:hypothetical protein C491_16967 [Natronococcus amylolyticus DSM 10524]|uniref:Pectate lyase superfamily protein domain-containing protein n=1 Tax=Natronococcus amylolyticus DSM 10524 TaxID=1227497 RepID=L9X127_9EURY|nr:hypothetical protein [Natronococcus amylolyticus]ELY55425.1 hypothetical protein C491_16967 [Natronococcus amylolyticus DSM 10524]